MSQCECTAQWQRINDAPTTTRRRDDDETTTRRRRGSKTKRTQVQPQTPTINGDPSLRIREKTQHQVAGDNLIAKWWRKQHNLASHPTIFVESSHNQHLGTHRHLYASMFTKEILGKPCNSCSDFLWRFLENGCLAFGRVTLSGQSVLQTTFDNEFILICDIYP